MDLSPGPPKLTTANDDPTLDTKAVPDLALEFELEVVSLLEKPVFTALSYYWGGKDAAARPRLPITVNGKTVGIQDTLEAALRSLQYEDMAPAIWIDWLCINQQDDSEKSDQVLKMREIYSTACPCDSLAGRGYQAQMTSWLELSGDSATNTADFSMFLAPRNGPFRSTLMTVCLPPRTFIGLLTDVSRTPPWRTRQICHTPLKDSFTGSQFS